MAENKTTILVEMLHGIGDTVCALPSLDLLREKFQNARIDVMVKFDTCKDIVETSHIYVDNIIVINIYDRIIDDIRLIKKLRENEYDYLIVNCATSVNKARLFAKIIRPKKWLGIQKNGYFLDNNPADKHFVELNLEAIKQICDIPHKYIYPKLYFESDKYNKILSLCENNERYKKNRITIGICIGNADPSYRYRFFHLGRVYTRGWGIDNMINLLNKLSKEDLNIILIGGVQEKELLEVIRQKKCNVGIDFVGKTTIKESIALLAHCDLVIGVDTGMQHVAAAVGSSTLSIFGPTNPKSHGALSEKSYFIQSTQPCQYCYGTEKYINCDDRKCLKSITVDMVINMVHLILQNRKGRL